MFECTLAQGEVFRKIIAAIQDLVQSGNFQCSEDGISLQGMDASHVSLVALALRKEGFEDDSFRCDSDMALGINFSSLMKMLKCMGSKDSLRIRAEEAADSALFMFESPDKQRVSTFELKLMDLEQDQLGIPETEYKAVVRVPADEFQRICRDLNAIGDTVTISATKEGIKFSVAGDIGSGDMTLRQSDSEDIDDSDEKSGVMIELEEPVSQTFALRYLNQFTKATSLSPSVTLSMGPEVPLVVEYTIENLGGLRFYLAPKIDDED
jgi:proliferating cell nuclear antigen